MTKPRLPMTQLPLALQLAPDATFDTYLVENANAAAVAHARALGVGQRRDAVWLAGPAGVGKSHLLQAACVAAGRAYRRAIYVPLERRAELDPGVLGNLGALDLVTIDALERVAGDAAWERALFDLLNATAESGSGVVLAARAVPAQVGFSLRDLASRGAGAVLYRIAALTDDGQITALIRHAASRGLRLDRSAAQFLSHRVARDMGTLCRWLDWLDTAALAAQQHVTIPLIRALLERRGSAANDAGRASNAPA